MSQSDGRLVTEVRDGIGWLIFDAQSRRNAINRSMIAALPEALAAFDADENVRVMVIRGAGERAFTAGADLSEMGDQPIRRDPEVVPVSPDEGFGGRALREFTKPIIAMIHGFCMGGGVMMAIGADLRIAADDAVFGIPAARIGVAYPLGAIDRLNHLIGPANTADLLYTARTVDAADAARIGLINRVVPKAELEAAVLRTAAQIAANAPLTIRSAKIAIAEAQLARSERDETKWLASMRACMESDDFSEGRRAFAEKRSPKFQGR